MANSQWTEQQGADFKALAEKPSPVLASMLVDLKKELADSQARVADLESRLRLFGLPGRGSITIN